MQGAKRPGRRGGPDGIRARPAPSGLPSEYPHSHKPPAQPAASVIAGPADASTLNATLLPTVVNGLTDCAHAIPTYTHHRLPAEEQAKGKPAAAVRVHNCWRVPSRRGRVGRSESGVKIGCSGTQVVCRLIYAQQRCLTDTELRRNPSLDRHIRTPTGLVSLSTRMISRWSGEWGTLFAS